MVYNTAMHSALKMSPAEALLGVRPERRTSVPDGKIQSHKDAGARVKEMLKMREELRKRLEESKAAMKRAYDEKHMDKSFAIGQWVMLRNMHIDSGRPYRKLDNRYVGPFTIAGIVGKQAYKMILTPTHRKILLFLTYPVSIPNFLGCGLS
jgi:hypothetical protein